MVLGTLIAGGLYQTLRFQQRIYRQEQATVTRHDALRLAGSVLAANLLEASGREGDFGALGPDNVAVRSPVGFAIVCDLDAADRRLGLFGVSGRLSEATGDSLLVYHPDGWLVREITQVHASGTPLSCPYTSGPGIELIVRLDNDVNGVPIGAPVRAFHSYTYRLEQEGSEWWLARDDGSGTEILAGPFSGDGSGLAFSYVDSAGQATTNPSLIVRVDLTLVAENRIYETERDTLTTSVRPRNQ